MSEISKAFDSIKEIADRYGLKILHTDVTDVTFIIRIGFSQEMFVQIYTNTKKEKLNMALIVAGERIYGIDKEGGYYHEHPFDSPSLHLQAERMEIESFVVNSLEFLRRTKLI